MSNIYNRNCEYFQLPKYLASPEVLAALNVVAYRVLIALAFRGQQYTSVEHDLCDQELARLAGCATRSLLAARAELIAAGLINAVRNARGYRYSLLNPDTGQVLTNYYKSKSESRGARWDIRSLTDNQVLLYLGHRLDANAFRHDSNGIKTLCPFHDDRNPSLSISLREKRWNCFGCRYKQDGRRYSGGLLDFEATLSKCDRKAARRNIEEILGLKAEIKTTYLYCSEDGELLYEVVRYEPKDFRQRRPNPSGKGYIWNLDDVRRVLYRLPEVACASHVLVTEGEKDADRVSAVGMCDSLGNRVAATTCANGAGSWRQEYSEVLKGKLVTILADADETGMDHAEHVRESILPLVAGVRIIICGEDKDVSDYLDKHNVDELLGLINAVDFETDKPAELDQLYQNGLCTLIPVVTSGCTGIAETIAAVNGGSGNGSEYVRPE